MPYGISLLLLTLVRRVHHGFSGDANMCLSTAVATGLKIDVKHSTENGPQPENDGRSYILDGVQHLHSASCPVCS